MSTDAEAVTAAGPELERKRLAGRRADARSRDPQPARRTPAALDLLVDVHAATRRVPTIGVDAVLVYLAALAVSVGTPTACLVWAAVVMVACYAAQVYADRDSVQTQGVLWFVLRPIAPVVVVCFVAATGGLLDVDTAGWFAGAVLAALFGLRCLLWPVLGLMRRRGLALRRTLILGTDEISTQLWRGLADFPEAGLVPVEALDWSSVRSAETVEAAIEQHDIAHVILVTGSAERLRFTGSLRGESRRRVRFSVVPVFAELFVNPGTMTTVASIPLVPLGQVMRLRRGYAGKRALDILGSLVMLVLTSPLVLLTAIAIRVEDGGPVFFRQSRVGLEGRTFPMLKLRSMRVGADGQREDLEHRNASDGLLFKLDGDPRVTRVGSLIRRTSIDELPQLVNVLLGQMSLVGPRPLPVAPERFDAWDNERHATLPGITGYWQISGGTALGYDAMVRLDLAYIRNASLLLDLRLLARTVPALLHRRGPA